jgi:CheY-like chemotaxis protein
MAPSIAAAEAGGCLVLLAEDHPINRTVLIQQVTRAGFALEVAVDGQEAFDRWLTGRYGLILTDLHMPRMDGYQLTEAVRNFESLQGIRRTPIIALTANALDGEAERCLLLGMDDYLIKPVTISQLGTKLHQWMPGLSPAEHPPAADIPPARAGAQPTLDVTVLQELCGIGSGAADEILDSFIATTEADLQQLEEYSTRQDWPGLARVAHRIKGASNTVGARELAARAALLESLAASEGVDASSFQEPLEEIQHAFRALLDHRGRTR